MIREFGSFFFQITRQPTKFQPFDIKKIFRDLISFLSVSYMVQHILFDRTRVVHKEHLNHHRQNHTRGEGTPAHKKEMFPLPAVPLHRSVKKTVKPLKFKI